MVCCLATQIFDLSEENNKSFNDVTLYEPIKMYVYGINIQRNSIYRHLFDHLRKGPHYSINAIDLFMLKHDVYKDKNLLDLVNYDFVFKPKPKFCTALSSITFVYRSGYVKELLS